MTHFTELAHTVSLTAAALSAMALATLLATGHALPRLLETAPKLQAVIGRMEVFQKPDKSMMVVDYAHTPDALEKALQALRVHCRGKLWCIFGCGGDRDNGKRPMMAEIAERLADHIILTDDNPRSEDPAVIRAAVKMGAPEALEVGDRAEAILRGVDALGAGDALLICGKGHESGQIVGNDILPFDDVEQASMAVAVLDGKTI